MAEKSYAEIFAEHNATDTTDRRGNFKTQAPAAGKGCECEACELHRLESEHGE